MDRDDLGKLGLRVLLGGLMLLHGIAKLRHGIGGIEANLARHGLPEVIAYGVYVGEVLAPLALIAGAYTRIAALVLAFNMAVAIALSHWGDIGELGRGGGWAIELQMLYLVGAVCVALLGPGRYRVPVGSARW